MPKVKEKGDVMVQAIRTTGPLHCSTGRINGYREAFLKGMGGSRKDPKWNKQKKQHDCCKSKVAWRHKVDCNYAIRNASEDLSDLKEVK